MTTRFPDRLRLSLRQCAAGALCALMLGAAGGAMAERADRNKPMNIEADSMRYDDLKQTSVFTGNVVVTKGTIIIRGTRIDVRQDPDGFQYVVVTAEPGKRAYYKQKRDSGKDEWVEGESEVIEYDGRADNVKFIRRANMRRLVGTAINDETSGPLITYDQSNDTFTVNGSALPPNASVNAPNAGGRVRAVLAPRAGTPGAQDAPVAPAASDRTLRPSTDLNNAPGGEGKRP